MTPQASELITRIAACANCTKLLDSLVDEALAEDNPRMELEFLLDREFSDYSFQGFGEVKLPVIRELVIHYLPKSVLNEVKAANESDL